VYLLLSCRVVFYGRDTVSGTIDVSEIPKDWDLAAEVESQTSDRFNGSVVWTINGNRIPPTSWTGELLNEPGKRYVL